MTLEGIDGRLLELIKSGSENETHSLIREYSHHIDWNRLAEAIGEPETGFEYNILGYMYSNGLGKEKDICKAIYYYQKAADLGSSAGQYNLGLKYRYKIDENLNYEKAIHYFQLSAKQGNLLAFKSIAHMYEEGEGVEKDKEKAIYYYSLANAYDNICEILKKDEELLTKIYKKYEELEKENTELKKRLDDMTKN